MKEEYSFKDAVKNPYVTTASADVLDWAKLTPGQKKVQLYFKQKRLLDTFLVHGAITQAQYEKSLHDMTEKMGVQDVEK